MPYRGRTQLSHLDIPVCQVYRRARACRGSAALNAFFTEARVPPDARKGIRRLLANDLLCEVFDELDACEALMSDFPSGHLNKLLSLNWHEVSRDVDGDVPEIEWWVDLIRTQLLINYGRCILAGWYSLLKGLEPIRHAFQRLDEETITAIRLRAPGTSRADFESLRDDLRDNLIFPRFTDAERERISECLKLVKDPLLDLKSLVEDVKLVIPCVSIVRQLEDPVVGVDLDRRWSPDVRRPLLEFTMERIEDLDSTIVLKRALPVDVVRQEAAWRQLAQLASSLGAVSSNVSERLRRPRTATQRVRGSAKRAPIRSAVDGEEPVGRREGRPTLEVSVKLRLHQQRPRRGQRSHSDAVTAMFVRQSKIRAFLSSPNSAEPYSMIFSFEEYASPTRTDDPRHLDTSFSGRDRTVRSYPETESTATSLIRGEDDLGAELSPDGSPESTYTSVVVNPYRGELVPFDRSTSSSRYTNDESASEDNRSLWESERASQSSVPVPDSPAVAIKVFALDGNGLRALESIPLAELDQRVPHYGRGHILYEHDLRTKTASRILNSHDNPQCLIVTRQGDRSVVLNDRVRDAVRRQLRKGEEFSRTSYPYTAEHP